MKNILTIELFASKSLAADFKSDWIDLLQYGDSVSFQIDTDEDTAAGGRFGVEVSNKLNSDPALGFSTYADVAPDALVAGAQTQFVVVSAARSRYVRLSFVKAPSSPGGLADCNAYAIDEG